MSLQSHYRINVSEAHPTRKQWGTDKPAYLHLFATSDSLTDLEDARYVLAEMIRRFPAPRFKVEMTHWRIGGTHKPNEGWLSGE